MAASLSAVHIESQVHADPPAAHCGRTVAATPGARSGTDLPRQHAAAPDGTSSSNRCNGAITATNAPLYACLPPPPPSSQTPQPLYSDVVCSICLDTTADSAPFISPCRCAGTMAFVHEKCINQWIRKSGNRACTICHTPYQLFVDGYRPFAQWLYPKMSPSNRLHLILSAIGLAVMSLSVLWVISAVRDEYMQQKEWSSEKLNLFIVHMTCYAALDLMCLTVVLLELKFVAVPYVGRVRLANQHFVVLNRAAMADAASQGAPEATSCHLRLLAARLLHCLARSLRHRSCPCRPCRPCRLPPDDALLPPDAAVSFLLPLTQVSPSPHPQPAQDSQPPACFSPPLHNSSPTVFSQFPKNRLMSMLPHLLDRQSLVPFVNRLSEGAAARA